MRCGIALGTVALAVGMAFAPAATAKPKHTIKVRPGPNAISKAIDRAEPGDRIVLRRGKRYKEDVVVDKRVRIVGAKAKKRGKRRKRPVVDGGCDTRFTIAVRAEGVKLKRLKVVGADEGFGSTPSEVDFTDISHGRTEKLRLVDTCDAEYGLNVLRSGPVKLIDTTVSGFDDAGIYVGTISDTEGGQLLVSGTNAFNNQIGVLIEFSAGGDIRVADNFTHDNRTEVWTPPAGILIYASDGVTVEDNRSVDNGRYGIHLKREGMFTADNNRLFDNVASGNPTAFFAEGGSANCGSGNSFGGLPPC